jgi:peptide/nickel transport system permease protein
MLGLFLVLALIISAIFAPFLVSHPEHAHGAVDPKNAYSPPSLKYPFGTDGMGRDIYSRIVYGARISLKIGCLVIFLCLLVGTPLGVVAGFAGGKLDEVIMRITDVFLGFPPLLLAMAISAALGPNLTNAMIAIAASWWPWYTRLLRGEAVSVKERAFVEAARAVGVSSPKIVLKHILPNCLTPVIVQASMDFGSIILTSASLSFLGLGAQPPTPEWGLMVNIERVYFLDYWWGSTFPGLAIFMTVLAFNLLGDGLREILDPKLRRK